LEPNLELDWNQAQIANLLFIEDAVTGFDGAADLVAAAVLLWDAPAEGPLILPAGCFHREWQGSGDRWRGGRSRPSLHCNQVIADISSHFSDVCDFSWFFPFSSG